MCGWVAGTNTLDMLFTNIFISFQLLATSAVDPDNIQEKVKQKKIEEQRKSRITVCLPIESVFLDCITCNRFLIITLMNVDPFLPHAASCENTKG